MESGVCLRCQLKCQRHIKGDQQAPASLPRRAGARRRRAERKVPGPGPLSGSGRSARHWHAQSRPRLRSVPRLLMGRLQ